MRVKFGDVVVRANTKEDRFNTDKLYYVGGEHIETGEYLVTKRGLIAGSNIGPMFYFGFRKGQVLLASRSPDLKKAGMVTFDGICSEKTFVIETRDENILLQSFLPIIVRSEAFWEYANNNQSGSVNHFINWSTFSAYEFDLPSLEEQRELSEIVWAMVDAQRAYKALIAASDELVKSQFIAEFGDPIDNPMRWDTKSLLSLGSCKNGMNFHSGDTGVVINCLGVGDFKDNDYIRDTSILPTISLSDAPSDDYLLKDGDIVFVRSNGNKAMVGRSVAVFPGEIPTTFSGFCIRFRKTDSSVLLPFLLRALKTDSIRKKMYGRGANIQNLNQQTLASLYIPIPPLDKQEEYISFVRQLDKSKHSAQKALEDLQATQKALIRKYLG